MVKCREDSKICDGLVYLDDKTEIFYSFRICLNVYMYLFAIDNKPYKNRSFSNPPISELK